MPMCYIAYGSNLGRREAYVQAAIQALENEPAIHILRQSPVYETEPVDMPPDAPPFLNGVIEADVNLTVHELLAKLKDIEASLGRARSVGNQYISRTIDLDILLFGETVLQEEKLTIPHPHLLSRWFVLKPLCDLCPTLTVPGTRIVICDAMRALEQQ